MQEIFGIAAFRSRQQVTRFDAALRRNGIRSQVISTPRDVSIGCGLSVRFDLRDAPAVQQVYHQIAVDRFTSHVSYSPTLKVISLPNANMATASGPMEAPMMGPM